MFSYRVLDLVDFKRGNCKNPENQFYVNIHLRNKLDAALANVSVSSDANRKVCYSAMGAIYCSMVNENCVVLNLSNFNPFNYVAIY